MNIKILLIAFSAATILSCNTAYKSGQTPDDVYYSPVKVVEEDSKQEEEKEVASTETNEERAIRMKARDRRWRDLENNHDCYCSCDYNPYKYGYNYGYYYNPYYYPYPVYSQTIRYTNPKTTPYRSTTLAGYSPVKTVKYANNKTGANETRTTRRTYNTTNNSTREVFTPQTNTRVYSPSSSGSSSGNSGGSGSSGSGKSVSRPARN